MLGVMLTTSFLSMWINNTATTAMMVPIVDAVMQQLYSNIGGVDNAGFAGDDIPKTGNPEDPIKDRPSTIDSSSFRREMSLRRLRVGLFLSVAYASNIGGTGALNGTGPNLVLKGVVEQRYGVNTGLNFATWFLFCFPLMVVCIFLAWLWLQTVFVGRINCKQATEDDGNTQAIRQVIREKYEKLGPIKFPEAVATSVFCLLVLAWVFRDPKFIDGWNVLFPLKNVGDATVVMMAVVLLFAIPVRFEKSPPDDSGHQNERLVPILNWQVIHEKLQWNVILLIGGGFATAEASKMSGLSAWIGRQLVVFKSLPSATIVFLISLMTAILTEVTSNVATASLFLPVLADMSEAIQVHPLYSMLPATLAASFAFMLPIATPPNAIVFTAANMKTTDMVFSGLVMNVVCVAVTSMMINTLGLYMFDLNTFPAWAENFVATTAQAQNTSLSP